MPEAVATITTPRRPILAGGIASLFAGIAATAGATAPRPSGPDAELIAACAAFDVLIEEFHADPRDQPCGSAADEVREANDARIKADQDLLLRRIEALPACKTLEGAHALARTLILADTELLPGLDTRYHDDALMAQLLCKLGAEGVPALAMPIATEHPDAALLRLGAELDAAWARENAYFATRMDRSTDDADAAMAPCEELISRIERCAATTLEGLLVKARAFTCCRDDCGKVDLSDYVEQTTDTRIAGGILADLMSMISMPVAPVRPLPPQDPAPLSQYFGQATVCQKSSLV